MGVNMQQFPVFVLNTIIAFTSFDCSNFRERKKVEKKAVTKNKNLGGGEKKFFDIFFSLNKIKRNVSIVEFCARRRVIFLKMFFSLIFSLEYANFCSILQSNQSVVDFLGKWWFLSRIDSKFTTSVGRAHAIQKCADIDFFSGNIIYNRSTSFRQNAFCFVSLRII